MEIGQCEHLIERYDGPLQRCPVFLSGRLLIITDGQFGRGGLVSRGGHGQNGPTICLQGARSSLWDRHDGGPCDRQGTRSRPGIGQYIESASGP